jgi:hypothetical protein
VTTEHDRDAAERDLIAALEAARPNQLTEARAEAIRAAERRLREIEDRQP